MTATPVLIIPTGVANAASVRMAIGRAGGDPHVAQTPEEILSAPLVVLPGVGSFSGTVKAIRQGGFEEPLRSRMARDLPTLAICAGMQALFESSEESPGVEGLHVLKGQVQRLEGASRVPHMGWSYIVAEEDCRVLQSGYAYFAHSYGVTSCDSSLRRAIVAYHGDRVAGLERGNLVVCQFHPELSGKWGDLIWRRWIGLAEGIHS